MKALCLAAVLAMVLAAPTVALPPGAMGKMAAPSPSQMPGKLVPPPPSSHRGSAARHHHHHRLRHRPVRGLVVHRGIAVAPHPPGK